jgi:hypothetical protein
MPLSMSDRPLRKRRKLYIIYLQWTGNVPASFIAQNLSLLATLRRHYDFVFKPAVDGFDTIDNSNYMEGETLSYEVVVMLVSESRPSEDAIFSGASKALEAIAFLASHGPLDVVVFTQGPDALYTSPQKLGTLFEIPNTC